MAKPKKKKGDKGSSRIATNKRARYDYLIEDTFEGGLVLQGWEVKSLREGRVQLSESYVCLLYTSPSPRDLSTSRMPSSA